MEDELENIGDNIENEIFQGEGEEEKKDSYKDPEDGEEGEEGDEVSVNDENDEEMQLGEEDIDDVADEEDAEDDEEDVVEQRAEPDELALRLQVRRGRAVVLDRHGQPVRSGTRRRARLHGQARGPVRVRRMLRGRDAVHLRVADGRVVRQLR